MSDRPATATIWRTKGGSRIRVTKMDDGHLVNTISFLRRWAAAQMEADRYYGCVLASERDDFLPADGEDDEDIDTWLAANHPTWPALVREAERRELMTDLTDEQEQELLAAATVAVLKTLDKGGRHV